MVIFPAMRQNLCAMAVSAESLEKRIQSLKHQISELGDLRPGALSKQYNICGNPNCRCKATPPLKHGPYYQISFTRHGKSSSQFVRDEDLDEVQQQLENYRLLRQLDLPEKDMFRSRDDVLLDAYKLQEARIAYTADKSEPRAPGGSPAR